MTAEQEGEIAKMIFYLENRIKNPTIKLSEDGFKRTVRSLSSLIAMKEEIESLRAFKRTVDEALNSGDGVYRP